MTVIPSGNVTTSCFSVEVASPCALSYVCGIFVSRSNPVAEYAASEVTSAVNAGSINNRSQPTIGPNGIGVGDGIRRRARFAFLPGGHTQFRAAADPSHTSSGW